MGLYMLITVNLGGRGDDALASKRGKVVQGNEAPAAEAGCDGWWRSVGRARGPIQAGSPSPPRRRQPRACGSGCSFRGERVFRPEPSFHANLFFVSTPSRFLAGHALGSLWSRPPSTATSKPPFPACRCRARAHSWSNRSADRGTVVSRGCRSSAVSGCGRSHQWPD